MRLKTLFILPLFLTPIFFWGCSSDISCGDTVCTSGEVCENNRCVLGLSLGGGGGDENCNGDEDCPAGKVCTLPVSDPGSNCIRLLSCDDDQDCQSGLACSEDGICR